MSTTISPSERYISVGIQQQHTIVRRRRSFPNATKPISKIIPSFFKRLKFSQMDFELACWQILWLCLAPRRVYRNIYYHKQTKNQWARDDPAFFVIQLAGLFVICCLYSILYSVSFGYFMRLLLWMIVVDYLLVGIIVATIGWWLSNKFLLSNHIAHSVEQSVEWLYSFDIHCNSFVPVFFLTYVLQLFFVSILVKDYVISRFLGNTLYAVASLYYIYITYLGYSALPFLHNTMVILYPAAFILLFYFISLFGFHISQALLHWYFGS